MKIRGINSAGLQKHMRALILNQLKEIGWKIHKYLEAKPLVLFSISFYLAYSILCLIVLGALWVGLSLAFSLLVLVIAVGWGGRKRYSMIGGYYWTESKFTADFGILLFLMMFLICTDLPLVVALTDLGFVETWVVTIIVFIIGLALAMVLAVQKITDKTQARKGGVCRGKMREISPLGLGSNLPGSREFHPQGIKLHEAYRESRMANEKSDSGNSSL